MTAKETLDQIKEIAEEAQGEWIAVARVYCPLWTFYYKDIVSLVEDYYDYKESEVKQ